MRWPKHGLNMTWPKHVSSGMFVLFAVNFKLVAHFCGERKKNPVFFGYFAFDSVHTHRRAESENRTRASCFLSAV